MRYSSVVLSHPLTTPSFGTSATVAQICRRLVKIHQQSLGESSRIRSFSCAFSASSDLEFRKGMAQHSMTSRAEVSKRKVAPPFSAKGLCHPLVEHSIVSDLNKRETPFELYCGGRKRRQRWEAAATSAHSAAASSSFPYWLRRARLRGREAAATVGSGGNVCSLCCSPVMWTVDCCSQCSVDATSAAELQKLKHLGFRVKSYLKMEDGKSWKP
nr:RNA pseudouridine synthase 6, chloroplastic [Ipomoea batatas]